MTNAEKVYEYLEKAKVFYISTVDGDKPKVRPFSFKMIVDDVLYFGVGEFKDCYKQMQKNNNVEICASDGQKFLRFYGKAEFINDPKLFDKMMEIMPSVGHLYKSKGWKMAFFTLKPARAEFRNIFSIEETLEF